MIHLDTTLIDAILDGSLEPADAGQVREHLAQPCEICEQALDAYGLDLEVLLRLCEADDALAVAPARPLSELERAALWQSVQGDIPDRQAAPVRRPRWRVPAAGAVVIAMAAALLVFFRPPDPYDGIKGPGDGEVMLAPPALELRVVTGRDVAGSVELGRRVTDGEVLAKDLFLLFELQADRLAARYLFVVDGAGVVTSLSPASDAVPELQPAGNQRVGSDGSWVVLDLADMPGPLTIVAAAAALPVDAVTEVVRPWQADDRRPWVAYDSLRIEVAP